LHFLLLYYQAPRPSSYFTGFLFLFWLISEGSFWARPAKALGKPACALVDATFALDDLIQWLGMRFVRQRVPETRNQCAAGTLVDPCRQVLVPSTVQPSELVRSDWARQEFEQVPWLGPSVKAGGEALGGNLTRRQAR
jgi:hypothetical protein